MKDGASKQCSDLGLREKNRKGFCVDRFNESGEFLWFVNIHKLAIRLAPFDCMTYLELLALLTRHLAIRRQT